MVIFLSAFHSLEEVIYNILKNLLYVLLIQTINCKCNPTFFSCICSHPYFIKHFPPYMIIKRKKYILVFVKGFSNFSIKRIRKIKD